MAQFEHVRLDIGRTLVLVTEDHRLPREGLEDPEKANQYADGPILRSPA